MIVSASIAEAAHLPDIEQLGEVHGAIGSVVEAEVLPDGR